MQRVSPFRLMNMLFAGLAVSVTFGLVSSALLLLLDSRSEAQAFFVAYTSSFKTVVSLGLILGTAYIVFRTQNTIPEIVKAAFPDPQLAGTAYDFYEKRYYRVAWSIKFSAQFFVLAFVVFVHCSFPVPWIAEALMIIAVCTEYALGVYVGRKLCYAGMMLHALLQVKVTRNLFKERELDEINSYVNVVSTLTVIFVYIHVSSYYGGPFLYDSILGESIRPFLLLPAIIATPVLLIFNFYPRAVLRKLYSQSIDLEIKRLQETIQSEQLTPYEQRSYLIEVDKMSRDELRYSLQLSLNDLPFGITILVMVLEPLIRQ